VNKGSFSRFMSNCPRANALARQVVAKRWHVAKHSSSPSTSVSLMLVSCAHSSVNVFKPDFQAYIEHLEGIVPQKCLRCQKTFCLACGEFVHPETRPSAASKTNSDAPARNHPLFHCSNLQGVILGIGLFMVDRLFDEQKDFRVAPAPTLLASKKRKVTHMDVRYL